MTQHGRSLLLVLVATAGIVLAPAVAHADLLLQVAGDQHTVKRSEIVGAKAAPQFGFWNVHITFKASAAKRLCRITSDNIGKTMTMTLTGQELVRAVVQSGICGGKVVVSGRFSKEEADAIVSKLK